MVYENVYIGAFILSVGHQMGREWPDANPLASMNLYQQTPGDPLLGDLFADISGLSFVVEFKRNWSQVPNERDKLSRLELHDRIIDAGLEATSVSCHLLGYAVSLDGREISLDFCTYLALWDNPSGSMPPDSAIGLNPFVKQVFTEQIGAPTDKFLDYIELLSGGGGGGLSGLVVNCHREKGIRLFVVEEIRQLVQTRSDVEKLIEDDEIRIREQEPPDEPPMRVRS